MNMQILESKEKELNLQFEQEKQEAEAIEEQIKALQERYQEKLSGMMRIQGAFALLKDLKKAEEPVIVESVEGSPDNA